MFKIISPRNWAIHKIFFRHENWRNHLDRFQYINWMCSRRRTMRENSWINRTMSYRNRALSSPDSSLPSPSQLKKRVSIRHQRLQEDLKDLSIVVYLLTNPLRIENHRLRRSQNNRSVKSRSQWNPKKKEESRCTYRRFPFYLWRSKAEEFKSICWWDDGVVVQVQCWDVYGFCILDVWKPNLCFNDHFLG